MRLIGLNFFQCIFIQYHWFYPPELLYLMVPFQGAANTMSNALSTDLKSFPLFLVKVS